MADNKQENIQGWADVVLTPSAPLSVLINFLNVLNQRLVAIENVMQVPYENRMITLTELYAIQAELERKQQEQAQTDEKKDN